MINIEIDIKENNMSENQTYTPKGVEETKALGKDVLLVEDGEFKFYFRQPSPVEGMYFLDSAGKNSTVLHTLSLADVLSVKEYETSYF